MIQYKCDYNMMNEVNLYEKNGKIILGSELLDVGSLPISVGAATIDNEL